MKTTAATLVGLISFVPFATAQTPAPIDLFPKGSFELWERTDGKKISQAWEYVENAWIHLKKPIGRGGSLVTKQDYGDFGLTLEWKTAKGVNSGIKYRVRPFGTRMLGLEYQIFDKADAPALHRTGELYDLFPLNPLVTLAELQSPSPAINKTRIRVENNRIQHWLNGQLVVDVQVGTDEWKSAIQRSKFSAKQEFGMNQAGRIMLTDHKGEIWFRNAKLTPLDDATTSKHQWNLEKLSIAPNFRWLDTRESVRSLTYEGEEYNGSPTEVFAYFASPATLSGEPAKKNAFPGIVLLHGGGGTAFAEWAELWAKRGYAAIAMDLGGERPSAPKFKPDGGLIIERRVARSRLEQGGPNDVSQSKFSNVGDTKDDDWQFHAVSAAIRAHSLLRSLPEVNANRTAVTGISWGGYLTCLTASIDHRFKAAVPVYGCGFLYDGESVQRKQIDALSAPKRKQWIELYDPSSWLADCKTPIMFVNGVNDKHYPLRSYARSYSLVRGKKQYQLDPQMGHSHVAGWAPKEIGLFVDQYVIGATALPSISRPKRNGNQVSAQVSTESSIKSAELYFTLDSGIQTEREWQVAPAKYADETIQAHVPEGAVSFIVAVRDERDALVTSEVMFIN